MNQNQLNMKVIPPVYPPSKHEPQYIDSDSSSKEIIISPDNYNKNPFIQAKHNPIHKKKKAKNSNNNSITSSSHSDNSIQNLHQFKANIKPTITDSSEDFDSLNHHMEIIKKNNVNKGRKEDQLEIRAEDNPHKLIDVNSKAKKVSLHDVMDEVYKVDNSIKINNIENEDENEEENEEGYKKDEEKVRLSKNELKMLLQNICKALQIPPPTQKFVSKQLACSKITKSATIDQIVFFLTGIIPESAYMDESLKILLINIGKDFLGRDFSDDDYMNALKYSNLSIEENFKTKEDTLNFISAAIRFYIFQG